MSKSCSGAKIFRPEMDMSCSEVVSVLSLHLYSIYAFLHRLYHTGYRGYVSLNYLTVLHLLKTIGGSQRLYIGLCMPPPVPP
jgi:hypothetical protein